VVSAKEGKSMLSRMAHYGESVGKILGPINTVAGTAGTGVLIALNTNALKTGNNHTNSRAPAVNAMPGSTVIINEGKAMNKHASECEAAKQQAFSSELASIQGNASLQVRKGTVPGVFSAAGLPVASEQSVAVNQGPTPKA
jgi:hypothetical protein